jgi:hypothetical protein
MSILEDQCLVTPGSVNDQSEFWSVLASIDEIFSVLSVTDGALELAFDSLSALQLVFWPWPNFNTADPRCDTIGSIKHLQQHLPITIIISHLTGHQDEISKDLDRYATFNIKMDNMVKTHLQIAVQSPRHHLIQNKPWTILSNNKKITWQLTSSLYGYLRSISVTAWNQPGNNAVEEGTHS